MNTELRFFVALALTGAAPLLQRGCVHLRLDVSAFSSLPTGFIVILIF